MPNVIVASQPKLQSQEVTESFLQLIVQEIPDQISKHMNQLHNAQGNPEP